MGSATEKSIELKRNRIALRLSAGVSAFLGAALVVSISTLISGAFSGANATSNVTANQSATPGADSEVAKPKLRLLNAAGSTFVNPLFVKWFREYNELRPDVEVNYQSIGSGGGIRQLKKGTITFAATDVPLAKKDLQQFENRVEQFPVVLGAVAIAYHLSAVSQKAGSESSALRLSGPVLAQIGRGEITKWNDSALQELNPDLVLPDQEIVFVYRSDSSGTTGVFTDYLGKIDPGFDQAVGVGKSVRWPTGIGGKGNEGVTAHIKNIEGSLGYLELTYALGQKLGRAELKNQAGNFVKADLETVTEAARQGLKVIGRDAVGSITNSSGNRTYPIAAFAYVVLEIDAKLTAASERGRDLYEAVQLFKWAMSEPAQQMAQNQGYASLPVEVRRHTLQRLEALPLK